MEERRNGASVSYAYDKAGNRIKKADAQGATLYQFNSKNQLVTEEGRSGIKQYTYDCQGGIVEEKNPIGIRHFTYNSRHQQTKVETESGSIQENRYDTENLRYELLENGSRTSFTYRNGELLHEEGKDKQKTSYHLGAGIEAFRRGQELSYYHRDEQLSTTFITGDQSGIRNSYQYDAFGALLDSTEQSPNRIRYTGQQYDDLTGQYYLRARYYNPVLGRFMQEDVYQGDGLNLYAYCNNNSLVYWDPSGYSKLFCNKSKIANGQGQLDPTTNNNGSNTPLTFDEALEQLEQSGIQPGQTQISRSRVMEIVDSYDPTQAYSSIYTDSMGNRYLVEGHHTTVAATMLGNGSSFNMNIPTVQVPSATNVHWVRKWYEFWKKVIEVVD